MKTNLTALFKNRPPWQSRPAAQEALEDWNIFLLQPFSMFVYENKKFVKLPDDERGKKRSPWKNSFLLEKFFFQDNFILKIHIYLLLVIYYQVKMKVWIIVNLKMKSRIPIQNVLFIFGKEEMQIIQLGYFLISRKFFSGTILS
jgi:hypothetical protein